MTEHLSKLWVVYLNGKEFARAATHSEYRKISRDLAKEYRNATITQRYQGAQRLPQT